VWVCGGVGVGVGGEGEGEAGKPLSNRGCCHREVKPEKPFGTAAITGSWQSWQSRNIYIYLYLYTLSDPTVDKYSTGRPSSDFGGTFSLLVFVLLLLFLLTGQRECCLRISEIIIWAWAGVPFFLFLFCIVVCRTLNQTEVKWNTVKIIWKRVGLGCYLITLLINKQVMIILAVR